MKMNSYPKPAENELQEVSAETMRFMRGNYLLDEVAGKYYDLPCLKFRQAKKTILSINILPGRFDFQVIFGRAEREKFLSQRTEFPAWIQAIYDASKTYHDGKWLLIPVADLASLAAVQQLILIKKKPNRKPFGKDQAIYSSCGMRCDLCVHFTGGTISPQQGQELAERVRRVYQLDPDHEFPPCPGCSRGGISGQFTCEPLECARMKGLTDCVDCSCYPCTKATAGLPPAISWRSIAAADVTWAILPYVPYQYGN